MVAKGSNPETGAKLESKEAQNAIVAQPEKAQDLQGLLDVISLMDKVTENMQENPSENWSGAGSAQGGSQQGDRKQSVRAIAIANLPEEQQLRKELSRYIQKEIKSLRKEIRKKAFRASKPGSAYQLNELYKKMRRLNALLSELMEASFEVVKRLCIRVFIDKQTL